MKDIELFNDDCMNVLPTIPDESVDLIVSDIPYNIGCVGGGKNPNRPTGILTYENAQKGKMFDHNTIKFNEYLPELYRVLKQKTHAYLMINARNLAELQTEAEKVGFKFQQLLVWHKNNATPSKWYLNQCEFILMLRKGGERYINDMGYTNVLRTPNIIGNKLHPTQKPTMLMQTMVSQSSNEGDIVLDPFMGSGSTGIASKILNRKFIGIEIDKKYFDIAENRIKNEYKQMNLF